MKKIRIVITLLIIAIWFKVTYTSYIVYENQIARIKEQEEQIEKLNFMVKKYNDALIQCINGQLKIVQPLK